jgi:hypothetical protein
MAFITQRPKELKNSTVQPRILAWRAMMLFVKRF